MLIGIDTNSKTIGSEILSVSGIIHCVLTKSDPNSYHADFPWNGAILFRNCPTELHPEKFGWISEINRINGNPKNRNVRFAIITDHELDNHIAYNNKQKPIYRDFYLPDNFQLMYGRGDGSSEDLLSHIVKECDKKTTALIKEISDKGCYKHNGKDFSIDQIPIPKL